MQSDMKFIMLRTVYIVIGNDIWKHYVELGQCDLAQV
jgi:hypothetical protein